MVLPSPAALDASAGWDGHVAVQLIHSPPWRALEMLGKKQVLSLMLGIQVSCNHAAL